MQNYIQSKIFSILLCIRLRIWYSGRVAVDRIGVTQKSFPFSTDVSGCLRTSANTPKALGHLYK